MCQVVDLNLYADLRTHGTQHFIAMSSITGKTKSSGLPRSLQISPQGENCRQRIGGG